MERITSRQNPLVARCRRLAGGRSEADPAALIDGPHQLTEALDAHLGIESALFSTGALGTPEGHTLALRCVRLGVHTSELPDAVLAAASPVRAPSGVLALARVVEAAWDALVAPLPALVLVAVDVQDPGNLGAIVRAADAAGATGIVAAGASADPWGWKALRGAMGSAFRLPLRRERQVDVAVQRARSAGLRLLAMSPRADDTIYDLDLTGPVAIILGGEGQGLDAPTLAVADATVRIPMRPGVESLNVAVAAALVAYEAARQRHSHVVAVS
jgi:TrmH family RNA methyltransferase